MCEVFPHLVTQKDSGPTMEAFSLVSTAVGRLIAPATVDIIISGAKRHRQLSVSELAGGNGGIFSKCYAVNSKTWKIKA